MTTGCYRFVPTPASWLDAERDCEADAVDAHLVVIDSVDEHYTIHGLASQVADVWLAYTDRVTEGRLRWVAPGGIDPTSNNCFFGSAVNNDMLDCVTQDGPDACPDWRYRNCSEGHAYVCERDGASPDPTAYTPH